MCVDHGISPKEGLGYSCSCTLVVGGRKGIQTSPFFLPGTYPCIKISGLKFPVDKTGSSFFPKALLDVTAMLPEAGQKLYLPVHLKRRKPPKETRVT